MVNCKFGFHNKVGLIRNRRRIFVILKCESFSGAKGSEEFCRVQLMCKK